MAFLDSLGSPNHLFATRLTDVEQKKLDNYKKLYQQKHGKEPTNSRIGRIAVMKYVDEEAKRLTMAK